MDRQSFNKQLLRLKSQWPHSYGEERVARIWTSFQKVEDLVFQEIIDLVIDRFKSAPLIDDLCLLETEVRKKRSFYKIQSGAGFATPLDKAAKASKADPEFMKACIKLQADRQTGRITMKQFLEGCELLDTAANQINPDGNPKWDKYYDEPTYGRGE